MYHILVVDDEEKIRTLIRKYAEFEGHQVTEAENGMQAVEICRRTPSLFDIIIMDVMMPELDGFSAVAEIRKTCASPVLMLSARGEEYDKIHGFELGVDDYVVKPFSPRELVARVRAVLNRTMPRAETSSATMTFGDLTIDTASHTVRVAGEDVALTPKEFDLLVFLASNKGIALSREKILQKVWNYDYFGEDRTVDTHVKMLRGHLGKCRGYIATVWGIGYKFDPDAAR